MAASSGDANAAGLLASTGESGDATPMRDGRVSPADAASPPPPVGGGGVPSSSAYNTAGNAAAGLLCEAAKACDSSSRALSCLRNWRPPRRRTRSRQTRNTRSGSDAAKTARYAVAACSSGWDWPSLASNVEKTPVPLMARDTACVATKRRATLTTTAVAGNVEQMARRRLTDEAVIFSRGRLRTHSRKTPRKRRKKLNKAGGSVALLG